MMELGGLMERAYERVLLDPTRVLEALEDVNLANCSGFDFGWFWNGIVDWRMGCRFLLGLRLRGPRQAEIG